MPPTSTRPRPPCIDMPVIPSSSFGLPLFPYPPGPVPLVSISSLFYSLLLLFPDKTRQRGENTDLPFGKNLLEKKTARLFIPELPLIQF